MIYQKTIFTKRVIYFISYLFVSYIETSKVSYIIYKVTCLIAITFWATIGISGNTAYWMCFVLWSTVLFGAMISSVLFSVMINNELFSVMIRPVLLMLWSAVYCFVLWTALYCLMLWSEMYCLLLWSAVYCLLFWSAVYCLVLWSVFLIDVHFLSFTHHLNCCLKSFSFAHPNHK